MKKIKVIIKDKTTLELIEEGLVGDQIDLTQLEQIDFSYIEHIIESGKDKVYENKLEQQRKILEAEAEQKHREEINDLKRKILSLEDKNKLDVLTAVNEEKRKYDALENKYQILESQMDMKIREKENEIENKYLNEISELKNKAESEKVKNQAELEKIKSLAELEKEKEIAKIKQLHQEEIDLRNKKELEKEKEISDLKERHNEEIRRKDETINTLNRQKTSLQTKVTGEDLEIWCDSEVSQYMQNGFSNCTWNKDNKVVKNDDESKGSKADFIFKIFVDSNHEEEGLLTSVCLEMKSENPDTKKKQTNEQFYKKLDENRNKKNCKYALLVSELEMENPKFTPIFKVSEYPDMYVVRPNYMMAFLNMITSLTTRFANLILSEKESYLELRDKLELIEEFNSIKDTYLDKPLTQLSNEIETIQKQTEGIRKAANTIDLSCEKITNNYINKINDKLSKFELGINKKIIKKME